MSAYDNAIYNNLQREQRLKKLQNEWRDERSKSLRELVPNVLETSSKVLETLGTSLGKAKASEQDDKFDLYFNEKINDPNNFINPETGEYYNSISEITTLYDSWKIDFENSNDLSKNPFTMTQYDEIKNNRRGDDLLRMQNKILGHMNTQNNAYITTTKNNLKTKDVPNPTQYKTNVLNSGNLSVDDLTPTEKRFYDYTGQWEGTSAKALELATKMRNSGKGEQEIISSITSEQLGWMANEVKAIAREAYRQYTNNYEGGYDKAFSSAKVDFESTLATDIFGNELSEDDKEYLISEFAKEYENKRTEAVETAKKLLGAANIRYGELLKEKPNLRLTTENVMAIIESDDYLRGFNPKDLPYAERKQLTDTLKYNDAWEVARTHIDMLNDYMNDPTKSDEEKEKYVTWFARVCGFEDPSVLYLVADSTPFRGMFTRTRIDFDSFYRDISFDEDGNLVITQGLSDNSLINDYTTLQAEINSYRETGDIGPMLQQQLDSYDESEYATAINNIEIRLINMKEQIDNGGADMTYVNEKVDTLTDQEKERVQQQKVDNYTEVAMVYLTIDKGPEMSTDYNRAANQIALGEYINRSRTIANETFKGVAYYTAQRGADIIINNTKDGVFNKDAAVTELNGKYLSDIEKEKIMLMIDNPTLALQYASYTVMDDNAKSKINQAITSSTEYNDYLDDEIAKAKKFVEDYGDMTYSESGLKVKDQLEQGLLKWDNNQLKSENNGGFRIAESDDIEGEHKENSIIRQVRMNAYDGTKSKEEQMNYLNANKKWITQETYEYLRDDVISNPAFTKFEEAGIDIRQYVNNNKYMKDNKNPKAYYAVMYALSNADVDAMMNSNNIQQEIDRQIGYVLSELGYSDWEEGTALKEQTLSYLTDDVTGNEGVFLNEIFSDDSYRLNSVFREAYAEGVFPFEDDVMNYFLNERIFMSQNSSKSDLISLVATSNGDLSDEDLKWLAVDYILNTGHTYVVTNDEAFKNESTVREEENGEFFNEVYLSLRNMGGVDYAATVEAINTMYQTMKAINQMKKQYPEIEVTSMDFKEGCLIDIRGNKIYPEFNKKGKVSDIWVTPKDSKEPSQYTAITKESIDEIAKMASNVLIDSILNPTEQSNEMAELQMRNISVQKYGFDIIALRESITGEKFTVQPKGTFIEWDFE